MDQASKSIRKADESAIALLSETMGENLHKVLHIDSYYRIRGVYVFLHFVKTDTEPCSFSLERDWNGLRDKVLPLWEFARTADGNLWLIVYRADRSAFKLLKIFHAEQGKVTVYEQLDYSCDQFCKWIQWLNAEALKG